MMEISSRMNCNVGKRVCLFGKQNCSASQQHTIQKFVVSCNKVKELSVQKGKTDTFYQVLSLSSENVGFDEIRKAYRRKALQFHPDVCPSSNKEECTRQFVELRKAYEVLADPESRRMYDYELSIVDSFGGRGHGRFGGEGGRGGFRKEVWERQLSVLGKRCGDRIMDRRKHRL